MCWGHYHRWHRYGHPQARPKRVVKPFQERLLSRFLQPAIGCWEYPTDSDRHPRIMREDGTRALARVVVWEQLVGSIEPGWSLYPLCRTLTCVRPDHQKLISVRQPAA